MSSETGSLARLIREIRRFVRWVPAGYWLLLAMAVYFVIALSFSFLRSMELQTSTWDLGIYQQALWSTFHSRPFYEAADYETGVFGSFLQVHSAYILYLVAPVYNAWPAEGTLFIIQSAVVAAAAVPLWLLGRDVTGSSRLGLAAGIMYLAWAPTLSSNLYDFHIEAFLPLEIFTFVAVWNRGRYGWGLLVAMVGFATMELMAVLLFFVGLFFLFPEQLPLREVLSRIRFYGLRWTGFSTVLRQSIHAPRFLASLGLVVLCAASYYLNLLLRERYLAPLLGIPPFPSHNSGYVIGGTLGELGLLLQNLTVGFTTKILTWIVLLALLGFVPLLVPRAVLLAVPWIAFTFLSSNLNYVTIGFQYGFIEAAALLVAFVFGLGALARFYRSRLLPASVQPPPIGLDPDPTPPNSPRSFLPRNPRQAARIAAGIFVLLLAVNLAFTPLVLYLPNLGTVGAGYRVATVVPPGYAAAESLAGRVPSGATVIASDNLFPLVANNVNAYSFFWTQNPTLVLPFNASHLPRFVFISESRTIAIPAWISQDLYNQSLYGLRGIAWSTAAGAVVLFEAGFQGPPLEYAIPPRVSLQFSGGGLDPQTGGILIRSGDPSFPTVVASLTTASGPIWSAPYVDLPVGNYTVTLGLRAHATDPSHSPSAGTYVLFVNANGFAQPVWFQASLPFGLLNSSGWVPVSFSISVLQPTLEVEVRGYLSTPAAVIELSYLNLVPTA